MIALTYYLTIARRLTWGVAVATGIVEILIQWGAL